MSDLKGFYDKDSQVKVETIKVEREKYSLKSSFCRSCLQDIRDSNGRISCVEMRVVSSSRDCNSKSISGDSGQSNAVILPAYPICSLITINEKEIDDIVSSSRWNKRKV
jgi:hypothetical protein